jgi:hypothetical protein
VKEKEGEGEREGGEVGGPVEGYHEQKEMVRGEREAKKRG